MADKADKAPEDTRAADRQAELDRQAAVQKAIDGVTRDKAGNPIPIVVNPLERPDGSLREG